MKARYRYWWISLGLAALIFVPACSTPLETGGAYAPATTNAAGEVTALAAPDKTFYAIEASFALAYDACQTVFKFERDNRLVLWQISPEIKHTLDRIRPQALDAVRRYGLARTAYKANPIPANLSGLQTVLAQLQALSAAAAAALPTQPTKP